MAWEGYAQEVGDQVMALPGADAYRADFGAWLTHEGASTTDPEAWKEGAEKHQGSWWPAWCEWVGKTAGKPVAAPKQLGSDAWPVLESAPGAYVLEKVPQN